MNRLFGQCEINVTFKTM